MFRKNKTTAKAASGNDLNTLLDVFDKIISGEISHTGESPADTTLFENPEVANKFNEVVETYKRFNNNFVMRLNEAMESIGDNSYVKNMMDEVQSQAQAIGAMGESGHNLEESINHINVAMADIKDNTHEMLAATQNSTANMNESIKVVNESSEKISDINRQVQEFQDKIHKIGEIVDIVKKVASQSNLLALNASIEAARAGEAGKGFAVVADEVRQLADSSKETASNIQGINSMVIDLVRELIDNSNEIIRYMEGTILPDYDNFVASGKHYSDDAAHINGQMIDYAERSNTILSMVSQMVDSINGITEAVDEGANGVSSVADSIQTLVSEISVINTKMSENQEIAGSLQDEAKRFQA